MLRDGIIFRFSRMCDHHEQLISGPDSTVTVHADVGRTGEHQIRLIRGNSFKSFTGRTCHVVAKQIVYLVMADLFAFTL